MKKFNQVITVQVSVDSIAEQLLASFKDENPHKEMLAETIITIALNSKTVGMVYNNLNGFTNEINFEIGQTVITPASVKAYTYAKNEEGELVQRNVSVLIGKVKDIDLTREDKVLLEYSKLDRQGNPTTDHMWVSHLLLELANPSGLKASGTPEPAGAVIL